MIGNLTQIQSNLSILQNLAWIDRQTSAIFLEFSVFNVNINLFAYITILFEKLPTGNLIKSARIYPLSLLESNGSLLSMRIVFNIIFMILISCLIINEIRLMFKTGLSSYFRNLWNFVELAIIAFSWAAFSLYLYRLAGTNKILKKFKKSSNQNVYIRLDYMSFCNDTLGMCLAFCAFFGTFRFLKLLRFNTRITIFMIAFKKCFHELVGFMFIFLLTWMSFAQAFYLLFNDKLISNSTIVKTMETCFEILLGKFQSDQILKFHPFLGTLTFTVYNIVMVFLLINIFVTILSDGLSKIRHGTNQDECEEQKQNEPDIIGFLKMKLEFFSVKKKLDKFNNPKYVEKNYEKDFMASMNKLEKVRLNNF
jgi:polycystin 1L2